MNIENYQKKMCNFFTFVELKGRAKEIIGKEFYSVDGVLSHSVLISKIREEIPDLTDEEVAFWEYHPGTKNAILDGGESTKQKEATKYAKREILDILTTPERIEKIRDPNIEKIIDNMIGIKYNPHPPQDLEERAKKFVEKWKNEKRVPSYVKKLAKLYLNLLYS